MYAPTEPSILYAGRYLADFLGNHPFAGGWPFIAELARLERAILTTSDSIGVKNISSLG
jgi:hypothetical protein